MTATAESHSAALMANTRRGLYAQLAHDVTCLGSWCPAQTAIGWGWDGTAAHARRPSLFKSPERWG